MRVLVTGSREITDAQPIKDTLNAVTYEYFHDAYWHSIGADGAADPGKLIIVHGGCPTGADKIADEWAQASDYAPMGYIAIEEFPANWDVYGIKAGTIRNKLMVSYGADICVAFYKINARNWGTSSFAHLAAEAGIPVKEVWVT